MTTSGTIATLTPVAGIRAPSHTRTRILTTILEHYTALIDPMQIRAEPGDGGGFLLMPETYTPTVRELERLMRLMRDDRVHPLIDHHHERVSLRACWWHIDAWYIRATHLTIVPPKQPHSKRRGPHRLQVDTTGERLPIRITRRDPKARVDIAQLGVTWIAGTWALEHEPMLPNDLSHAA